MVQQKKDEKIQCKLEIIILNFTYVEYLVIMNLAFSVICSAFPLSFRYQFGLKDYLFGDVIYQFDKFSETLIDDHFNSVSIRRVSRNYREIIDRKYDMDLHNE